MDYRDYQAGVDQDYFWFKGKRLLIDFLLSQAVSHNNNKILNIGVGTGEDLAMIKKYGTLHVIDIDHNALDMISGGLVAEKKVADACNLPYPDASFDVIVAFDVVEHIEHDYSMVAEVYRVLKPHGIFIFTVPAYNSLFSAHDRALGHFRRYNKKMIVPLLKKFYKLKYGYWFFFLFVPAALSRLLNKHSASHDIQKLPAWLNALFYYLLRLEYYLLRAGISFPCGLTLYGIYKKP